MASMCFCGDWLVLACDSKWIAADVTHDRDVFVFDCSEVERRRQQQREGSDGAEETGSDKILAIAASPSGKLLAVTDDNKRLLVFRFDSSWRRISCRWVARRCTSMVFTQTEEELLVADKSGDVYLFSVKEGEKMGELKMGHLSMLLSVTLSHDDEYIITADRDEKIRVSRLRSPHNIQSFCLGHREFVTTLLVPPGHPDWLLSGSGDGTVRLWEYETGRQLQSLDLSAPAAEQQEKTVCRLAIAPGGGHVAVQCERSNIVQCLSLVDDLQVQSSLPLPDCPLDLTFDTDGRLWVMMDDREALLRVFKQQEGRWMHEDGSPGLRRAMEAFRVHWELLDAPSRMCSRFQHLRKVDFDNVSSYLQKKEERLQQKRRRTEKEQDDTVCS
ncbi:tRNA (guanine-N(7)-)-methyltransferase non-catalytic subunit wdr4 isoform X2 [Synchiropus splendidus]|uniref:tRNA (guanine-N(7)-)-methyltransferase non-catalytic subunit wdr4 isoform X2 n=1 Tax=Synchiropus splendidus TaxID=270530 RepID=UPI00237E4185|nr:tRNA (guanine-N(7)-)-methyltransferase non-catalytic subunit wdr4 isoform X2 [Synchiropus splendidus]